MLTDEGEIEQTYGESTSDKTISRNSSKTVFLEKSDGGENLAEKLMLPFVLTEAEKNLSGKGRNMPIAFF